MGRGFIDLLPWIPVNNVQGLNTPTHVDNVQMEMHGQRGMVEDVKTNKALNYKYSTHSHSETDVHMNSTTSLIPVSCM